MFKSNKRKNDHVYTFYDIEDFIEDLFEVQTHFLPKDKIKFTEGEDKWKSLYNFDIHFDDDNVEIELIKENQPDCCGVLINKK